MDAFRLAKLLARSVNVTLVVKKDSPSDQFISKEVFQANINIETIKFRNVFTLAIILGARRVIKDHQVRNVIFFGASEMRSLFFAFLGKKINLIIRHGTTKSTPKKDPLHKLVYSRVNWHIAICRHLAENVRVIIPFGKNARLKVIYSSLRHFPDSTREPTVRDLEPVRLLHVGRITDGKGQLEAVNACEILVKNKIRFELHCVGELDPDYEKRFRLFVSEKSYSDCIKLPGFCSNVSEYYSCSDIFIFPSKGEGLSNSFIEALGYGLLCIAFNNTSFPELRDLGFEFSLAKNQDLEDLKTKLLESVFYLRDNKTPVEKNVQLAKEKFSPERELDEYLDVLR